MRVTVVAEKDGEETRTNVVETHKGEKVDHLVKRISGLTSFQAYQLKVHGKTEFEENGWRVTVTLSESTLALSPSKSS